MPPIKADLAHETDEGGGPGPVGHETGGHSPNNRSAAQLLMDGYLGSDEHVGNKDGTKDPKKEDKKDPKAFDPAKAKARYRLALGNLLGNEAYGQLEEAITKYGATDEILKQGHGLVDDLKKQLKAASGKSFGLDDPEHAMAQLMGPLSELLKKKADAWLSSAAGKKLTTEITSKTSDLLRGHPAVAVGAVLLAAAAAYASDMPMEPLVVEGALGKHFAGSTSIDLGQSLKDVTLGAISAQMKYTATHLKVGLSGARNEDGASSGVIDLSLENKKKVDNVVTQLALDAHGKVSGKATAGHHGKSFNADLDAAIGLEGDIKSKLLLVLGDPKKVNQIMVNLADTKDGVGGAVKLSHDKGGMKAIIDGALGPQGDLTTKLQVAVYDEKEYERQLHALGKKDHERSTNPAIEAVLKYDEAGNLTEPSKHALRELLQRNNLNMALNKVAEDGTVSGSAKAQHHGKKLDANVDAAFGLEGDIKSKLLLVLGDPKKVNQIMVNLADAKAGVGGSVKVSHNSATMKAMIDGALGPGGQLSTKAQLAVFNEKEYQRQLKALAKKDHPKDKDPRIEAILEYDEDGNLTEASKLELRAHMLRNDVSVELNKLGDQMQLLEAAYTQRGKHGSITASGKYQEDIDKNGSQTFGLALADKYDENTVGAKYNTTQEQTTEELTYTHNKGPTALSLSGSRTTTTDAEPTNKITGSIADPLGGYALEVGTETNADGTTKHASYSQELNSPRAKGKLTTSLDVDADGKTTGAFGMSTKSEIGEFKTTASVNGDKICVAMASKTRFGKEQELESAFKQTDDGSGNVHVRLLHAGGQVVPCHGATWNEKTGTLSMTIAPGLSLGLANKADNPLATNMAAEEQLKYFSATVVQRLGKVGSISAHYDPTTQVTGGAFEAKSKGFHLSGGGEFGLGDNNTKSWFASIGYEDPATYTQFLLELKQRYAGDMSVSDIHAVFAFAISETRLRFEGVSSTGAQGKSTARAMISQPVFPGFRLLAGAQLDATRGEKPQTSFLGGLEYAGIPVYVKYSGKDKSSGKSAWSVGLLVPLTFK